MSVFHCYHPWQCRWHIKEDGILCRETAFTPTNGSVAEAGKAVGSAAVLHQQCELAD